jgi:hypothetical protein
LLLLQRAERAIRAGNPDVALALIEEIDTDRATLHQERLAMVVLAECQRNSPDAATRAHAFLAQHTDSVYAARILQMCSP